MHLLQERLIEQAVHRVRRLNGEDAHGELELLVGKAFDADLRHFPSVGDDEVVEHASGEARAVRTHEVERFADGHVGHVLEKILEG